MIKRFINRIRLKWNMYKIKRSKKKYNDKFTYHG